MAVARKGASRWDVRGALSLHTKWNTARNTSIPSECRALHCMLCNSVTVFLITWHAPLYINAHPSTTILAGQHHTIGTDATSAQMPPQPAHQPVNQQCKQLGQSLWVTATRLAGLIVNK